MPTQTFNFQLKQSKILSEKSIEFIESICSVESIKKSESIIEIGKIPKYYFFVDSGLFSYHYLTDKGEKIIKKFFLENDFIASLSASIQNTSSNFMVEALEKSTIVKIPTAPFKKLINEHHDIALFYIEYLEKNWVIKKEMLEIVLKLDDAKKRFNEFVELYPNLARKLKQHQIASYLGITPTQLSRIKSVIKHQQM